MLKPWISVLPCAWAEGISVRAERLYPQETVWEYRESAHFFPSKTLFSFPSGGLRGALLEHRSRLNRLTGTFNSPEVEVFASIAVEKLISRDAGGVGVVTAQPFAAQGKYIVDIDRCANIVLGEVFIVRGPCGIGSGERRRARMEVLSSVFLPPGRRAGKNEQPPWPQESHSVPERLLIEAVVFEAFG